VNATFNTLTLLTAAGIVALAASPVMAKSHVRPAPADAYGSAITSFAPTRGSAAQHVYAPNLRPGPYQVHGLTPDFQLSHW
jgi:hypothetical protein